MGTKRILYKTTDMGTNGTRSSKIRVSNLTDGGVAVYQFIHTPEARLLAVSAMSRTPYELIDSVGTEGKSNYFLVTMEDES